MDGFYSPGVLFALTDCTEPAREGEFNRWYNETYIPAIESLGFIRNTKRFISVFPDNPTFRGRPKYAAVSEIHSEDMGLSFKKIRAKEAELKAKGKSFDAVAHMVNTVFKRTGPEIKSKRTGRPVLGVHFVLSGPTDQNRKDEFNKWYNEKHGPDVLDWGYYDTLYRYELAGPNDPTLVQPPMLSLYETSMDPLKARQEQGARALEFLKDPLWTELLSVIWVGGYRQIHPLPKTK